MNCLQAVLACEECYQDRPDVRRFRPIVEDGLTQAYFDEDHAAFVFVGTNDDVDRKRDIMAMMDRGIHSGFKLAWHGVEGHVRGIVRSEGRQVTFTGHSLGASLAQVAAREFRAGDIHRVIGFGGPRWCDEETIEQYENEYGQVTTRFVFWDDGVTWLPPNHWGYKHGPLTYLRWWPSSWTFWGRHDVKRYRRAIKGRGVIG